MLAENRLQGPVDQRRLSATGHARDTDQRTQRERDIHIPQIIPARPFYRDKLSTSLRSHIDHIVRIQHHVFVMLDHDNRVARIAQLFQRVDQTNVIPLVQPYTRFIQDIKYIDQLATDLGRQTDALTLAPR